MPLVCQYQTPPQPQYRKVDTRTSPRCIKLTASMRPFLLASAHSSLSPFRPCHSLFRPCHSRVNENPRSFPLRKVNSGSCRGTVPFTWIPAKNCGNDRVGTVGVRTMFGLRMTYCQIDGTVNAVDVLDGAKPMLRRRALRDVTLILIGCTALFDSDVLVRWPN